MAAFFLVEFVLVISSVFNIAYGQTAASVSNATGDYFFVEDSTVSKQFTCPTGKGCHIHCRFANSCKTALIQSSPTWLHLECTGDESCYGLVLASAPVESATIICSLPGGQTCYDAEFTLTTTPTVTISCDNVDFAATSSTGGSCGYARFLAANAQDFTLDCLGKYDCGQSIVTVSSATTAVVNAVGERSFYFGELHGATAGKLVLSCGGTGACQSADIWPPHQTEYAFRMSCGYSTNNCYYVDVKVPSKSQYVDNYMELICPTTNAFAGLCDIDFCCADTGLCQTDTRWIAANNRYECDDTLCCPWSDADNMSQPPTPLPTTSPTAAPTRTPTSSTSAPSAAPTGVTSPPTRNPTDAPTGSTVGPTNFPTENPTASTASPTSAPTSAPTDIPTKQPTAAPTERYIAGSAWPGYELFIRGYNIWTLEISGNIILDINRLDANIEGYSREGGSCSLSALEFDSSYSSYESYAESDAVGVETGFSAGAGGAGGAYSQERSESKGQSASAQTYIYTMDLKCEVATASTNALNNLYFSSAFVNRLRILPDSYTDGDDLTKFDSFWDSYGTHFIKSAKLGGTIRGAMTASKCSVENSYSSSDSFEVCLNAEYKGAEGSGCYGESASSASGLSIQSSVTNTQVTVRGGATSTFTDTFNSFGDKTNDFQSWINTLDDEPDIVGGNLQPTHEALMEALDLGSHRLNDASDEDKTDEEWRAILTALQDAYEYKTSIIEEEDTVFSNSQCTLTCAEGALVLESCTCTDCSNIRKCCAPDDETAASDDDGQAEPASVSEMGKLIAQIAIPIFIVCCVCIICVRFLYKKMSD